MNGPVDVLAKIRAACDSDALSYDVYAVVVDLIAAARAVREADRAPRTAEYGPFEAREILDAALANVGGAA